MKRVGVSACLAGEKVRYDGTDKAEAFIVEVLAHKVELVRVCPEMTAGLGVPRPTIGIYKTDKDDNTIKVNDTGEDIGERLRKSFSDQVESLSDLDAFILKSKSPSCGVGSAKIHISGKATDENTSGFFVEALREKFPDLILFEETELKSIEGQSKLLEILNLKS